jgi:predicted membrane channel-forming protein YqfA (hemolysin III family)
MITQNLGDPDDHIKKQKIVFCIVSLIIICAVTVWVIKYVYPYLKRKLTRAQLYIIMGIISIFLFGLTLFILLLLFSSLRNPKNVHSYISDDDEELDRLVSI